MWGCWGLERGPVGQVQVLDGRTGRRLRTVAVGLGPAALAVDERYRECRQSTGTGAAHLATDAPFLPLPEGRGTLAFLG